MNWAFLYYMGFGIFLILSDATALKLYKPQPPLSSKQLIYMLLIFLPFGVGLGWAYYLAIPKLLGIKTNVFGLLLGIIFYILWMNFFSIKKWRAIKAEILQSQAEDHESGHMRVADLTIRNVTDYVSGSFLVLPYLVMFISAVIAIIWTVAVIPETRIRFAYLVLAMQLPVGFIMLACISWLMHKLVKEPLDLRSSNPAEFGKKMHSLIQKRVRYLLMFQYIYCFTAICVLAAFLVRSFGANLILIGNTIFLVSLVLNTFLSIREAVKLEAERWDREPSSTM